MTEKKQERVVFKVLREIPTIGAAFLFTYVLGLAVTLVIITPLKGTWIYDRVIFFITLATESLPTFTLWVIIPSIAVFTLEGAEYVHKLFKEYIRNVAKEEETV